MSSRCKTCHREIVWARSDGTGAPMPIDLHPPEGMAPNVVLHRARLGNFATVSPGPEAIQRAIAEGKEVGVSHFATCPHANAHRKGRG